jgi:cation diffusion facilitator CzcD-associated flavoprotein CzcO
MNRFDLTASLGVTDRPRPSADPPAEIADCQVAVIGAGPYGLAAAAHLNTAGIETRVFGDAMAFWRSHMPNGMFLRHATRISDPEGRYSLDTFKRAAPASPGALLPIRDFIAYGQWFQRKAVSNLDARKVALIKYSPRGFRLMLDDGGFVRAERVVIALGLANQAYWPCQFKGIDAGLVSHSSEHVDFARFRGCRVAVIGRGQSACETAVLLHEAGAQVEIVSRGPVHWIGSESPSTDSKHFIWQLRRILTPHSSIGPFPLNWLVDRPELMNRLPEHLRDWIGLRALKPAATAWLRPRAGGIAFNTGRTVIAVQDRRKEVTLRFDDESSATYDHVLLATGYRIDVGKFGIFAPDLLAQIKCADGYPVLFPGHECSVPGLHFVGAAAVKSFGPMMRFVSGTGSAARSVTKAALGAARARKNSLRLAWE